MPGERLKVDRGARPHSGLPASVDRLAPASPQSGIFALGTSSHAYLEFDLLDSVDASSTVALVAGLREPRTTIGGVNLVAGFRPELWALVAPEAAPIGLTGFNEALVGADGYTMPATQHDIVIWLTGASYDVVFDLSTGVVSALAGRAELAHEMVGWPYHHDLDLTGFIDGTENPTLVEAVGAIAVQPGSPGEGGSVLLLQEWEHDAAGWDEPADRDPGVRHGSSEGRQHRARPKAADISRRADRPGPIREDLPTEHRLRLGRSPRDDLRRLQRRAGNAGAPCSTA